MIAIPSGIRTVPDKPKTRYGKGFKMRWPWHFGWGVELLPQYGWYQKNADDRTWPVGQLRPNDWGLFDMLGNAIEWLQEPAVVYVTEIRDEQVYIRHLTVEDRMSRILRGGSFGSTADFLRSASRANNRPMNTVSTFGFRTVRTVP